ncbi:maleylacetoacetate isomerase [Ochrobactrum sp. 19YEA23]|uniref:maleylacetoacetate isomerase n=1 Tax=Ochrobactrum sp. 19YEA23 TaxID=3039854 RepID=UPI00247ACA3D|nr:maleylacetoacetate isomerase [Ochrobactrum sp. 19YEA23]
MTVTLYDYWRSSSAYRVRLALALKEIAYEHVPVDLTAGAQLSPEHLALQPQGLVPVLKIDGLVLVQSLAIIEYLDETRPDPALLPRDAAGRAHVRALAEAIACEIHPVSNLRVLAQVEAIGGKEARTTWNSDNIRGGLEAFEKLLDHPGFEGRFCYSDTPGMADCVLVPQLYNASRWGVEWQHLPRIAAVAKACAELPAFAAAAPEQFRPE